MTPLLSALVASGVLTQADAARIDRQLDPDAARLWGEEILTQSFERGLTAQQRRILSVLDAAQGQPTPRALERLWAQEDELLWAAVQDDLHTVAIDRGIAASIGASNPNTWQLVNEEVVNWVDVWYTDPAETTFGSIPNLNATSRQQFAAAFQAWQLGDRTPGNYGEGLPQLVNELVPIFGRERAERIAVTETTRVFSEAELAAGNANPEIAGWLYLTANDDRVTEACLSGANTVMLKGKTTFPDGMGPPPRHVRCRSGIRAVTQAALDALQQRGLVAS